MAERTRIPESARTPERTRTLERARILVVGDPLPSLKPSADTSLALAEAALASGRDVHWCEPGDVAIVGADVAVRAPRALSRRRPEGFTHDALPTVASDGEPYTPRPAAAPVAPAEPAEPAPPARPREEAR